MRPTGLQLPMRIPPTMQYAMDARPISRPAPMMGMMQTTYSPAPTQLSPYMQELMKNYGYNPSFTRPSDDFSQQDPMMGMMKTTYFPVPDNFSQPVFQEMPAETPLSPYMQQLLQNYRVNNMLAQRQFGGMMAQ